MCCDRLVGRETNGQVGQWSLFKELRNKLTTLIPSESRVVSGLGWGAHVGSRLCWHVVLAGGGGVGDYSLEPWRSWSDQAEACAILTGSFVQQADRSHMEACPGREGGDSQRGHDVILMVVQQKDWCSSVTALCEETSISCAHPMPREVIAAVAACG